MSYQWITFGVVSYTVSLILAGALAGLIAEPIEARCSTDMECECMFGAE